MHHHQAEYVRDDGKQDRYIAFLTVAQVLAGKAIHFAEQEDGHGGHQDGEAVDNSQYDEFVLQRHDA